jgi:hypothetical protein
MLHFLLKFTVGDDYGQDKKIIHRSHLERERSSSHLRLASDLDQRHSGKKISSHLVIFRGKPTSITAGTRYGKYARSSTTYFRRINCLDHPKDQEEPENYE